MKINVNGMEIETEREKASPVEDSDIIVELIVQFIKSLSPAKREKILRLSQL